MDRIMGILILTVLMTVFATAAGVGFEVTRESSSIAVRTDKTGFLTIFGAGHKHGILVSDFNAEICADPETLSGGRVVITVPTASLRIDTTMARKAAGLSPSDGPGADDVKKLQTKMLAPNNLAAEQQPEIRFESASVTQKGDGTLLVQGPLTVRGRSSNISVPLRVERNGKAYRFRGAFHIRQSDYGITPESIAGVVKVVDRVEVLLDLLTQPTGRACK
jgi:polyisoprenoid-binding protein YceI